MIKGKAAYFILGIVVVTAIILRLVQFFNKDDAPQPTVSSSTKEIVTKIVPENTEVEQNFLLEGEVSSSTEDISTPVNNLATLKDIKANSVISSPLIVEGEAPGTWFFEASFPVKLIDGDGNLIVAEPASAQSDPLTENFVPYKALLEFNTTATSGYLVLTNDNPSGLLEYELSVKIPVLFLNK